MSAQTLSWKIKKRSSNQIIDENLSFKSLGSAKNLILENQTIVLIDNTENVIAIPGVTGGEGTKVDRDSRELLVEIANFDPELVARNSFKLNYRSEANKLFAGDLNRNLTQLATIKLMGLLEDNQLKKIQKVHKKSQTDDTQTLQIPQIIVNWKYLVSRLDGRGLEYWKPIIEQKLVFLGNYNQVTNILESNIFYGKIITQEDLLEEVIRLIGFENLQPDYISFKSNNQFNSDFDKEISIKKLVASLGYSEVITRPFISEKMLINKGKTLKLQNPYSSLEPFYRDNLETSLLKVYSENLNRGRKNIQIFEVNEICLDGNHKPRKVLSALIETEDPYYITTLAHSLNNLLNPSNQTSSLENQLALTEIGQSINIGNSAVTQISNKLKKICNAPLSKTLWTLTTDLTNLDQISLATMRKYTDTTQYPSIIRNYSHQISSNLSWENVNKLIKNLVDNQCETKIVPIERFQINEFTDKLNFEIAYYSYTQTLKGELIDKLENQIKELIVAV